MIKQYNLDLPETLQSIQAQAKEIVEIMDTRGAYDLLQSLEKSGFDGSAKNYLRGEAAGMPYEHIYRAMDFVILPQLPEDYFIALLRDHVLEGLNVPGYNLYEALITRYEFEFFYDNRMRIVQQVYDALEASTQVLGTKELITEGSVRHPEVKNWLADYVNFPVKNQMRGNIEELAYINQSPNVRNLDQEDRKILIELLRVYDFARNRIKEYSATQEVDVNKFSDKDIIGFYADLQDLKKPATAEPSSKTSDIVAKKPINSGLKPPVAPEKSVLPTSLTPVPAKQVASYPNLPKMPMPKAPVSVGLPASKPEDLLPAPQKNTVNIPAQTLPKTSTSSSTFSENLQKSTVIPTTSAKQVNIQDLLNKVAQKENEENLPRGVVMGKNENVNSNASPVKQEVSVKSPAPEKDIAKKLDDLKKRSQVI